MIIVRLAGGLGNQIFQLGVALYLASRNNSKRIIIDDSALGNYDEMRKNELLNFFDFDKLDLEIRFENYFFTKLRIPKLIPLKLSRYIFISDKNFQIAIRNPNKFLLLDGYFQNCLFQEDFNAEIKLLSNIFINKNAKINNEGCIIHIRGGDFVRLGWNSVTPKEYYIDAIKQMIDIYKQNKFKIVTDDKNYAKTILNGLNIDYEFIGNSMYDDFYLIGSYKYRILSSSTFSMWASALGNNKDSIVIAPSFWTPSNQRDLFLPNEQRIIF